MYAYFGLTINQFRGSFSKYVLRESGHITSSSLKKSKLNFEMQYPEHNFFIIKVKVNDDYFDSMSEDKFKTSHLYYFMEDNLTYPSYENYKNEHQSEDYTDFPFSIHHLKERTIRFILKTTGWYDGHNTVYTLSDAITLYENYCVYNNIWTLTMPYIDTYETNTSVYLEDNQNVVNQNEHETQYTQSTQSTQSTQNKETRPYHYYFDYDRYNEYEYRQDAEYRQDTEHRQDVNCEKTSSEIEQWDFVSDKEVVK